ncbi:hypothetical protein H4Q26_009104 [Puccinia striiformis f. sp. tritici PST-130]|nr:hypothetical protein H4Q26_009104 [Puccinia striiformis f. sp. tritici PST-130]
MNEQVGHFSPLFDSSNDRRSRKQVLIMTVDGLINHHFRCTAFSKIQSRQSQCGNDPKKSSAPFMARLHEQFKYFLNKKVSEDPAWQAIHVIFSTWRRRTQNHAIYQTRQNFRYLQSSSSALYLWIGCGSDYAGSTITRAPLLSTARRESTTIEEKTDPSLEGSTISPSSNSFLSRLPQLGVFKFTKYENFKYDIQRIIDDFILLCIFVGNDFLPHLPNLHIDEGAIGVLFEIYKRVLPQAGGYLNDSGILHTHRLQLILDELVSHEYKSFESSHGIGLKRPGRPGVDYPVNDTQFALVQQVENFIRSNNVTQDLAEKLNLWISFDNDQESHAPLISLGFEEDDSDDLRLADPVVDAVYGSYEICGEEVLSQYKPTATRWYGHRRRGQETEDDTFHKTLRQWKTDYYYDKCDCIIMIGLQWVLHYYYTGVASWSWAYPYHYSPMITDLDKMASYKFSFDLGNPFKPFEQLMGVLPGLSSTHVPPAFRKAFESYEVKLKDEEVERNRFGPTWQFRYDSQKADYYPSPLPDHFPHLGLCHSQMTVYHLPVVLKKNPGNSAKTDAASQNIENYWLFI